MKVCVLRGVREYAEGLPVELILNETGRLVVRAFNEAGHNCVEIDLHDLLHAIKYGDSTNGRSETLTDRLPA